MATRKGKEAKFQAQNEDELEVVEEDKAYVVKVCSLDTLESVLNAGDADGYNVKAILEQGNDRNDVCVVFVKGDA